MDEIAIITVNIKDIVSCIHAEKKLIKKLSTEMSVLQNQLNRLESQIINLQVKIRELRFE